MSYHKFQLPRAGILFCAILLVGAATVMAQLPFAGIPRTISYQGVLDQSNGSPVADGNYSLTFRLYTFHIAIIGGHIYSVADTLWTETQSVTVSKGIFNVVLGSVTPLNLPFDQEYSLGITVGSGSELTPRIPLTSAPYSLHALYADSATAISSATVPFSLSGSSSNAIISGTNSGTGSAIYGTNTVGNNYGGIADNGWALFGQATNGGAVYARSSSGVGVAATSTSNEAVSAVTVSDIAVDGVNTNADNFGDLGTPAYGVFGHSLNNRGVYGIGPVGVEGQNIADTNNYGELGISGEGVEGVTDNGFGVYGFSSSTNPTLAGVWGVDNDGHGVDGMSVSGSAVYGDCTGNGYAGYFQGNVYIHGNYSATGTKTAEVKLNDGSPVRLFCEESAEVYFTDYGEGQLVNGKAHINLDPTFIQTVTIDPQYPLMVFVQVEGDCKGVYVSNKTATSFDVSELQGGTSNVGFSYRVVCKRKYFENERLATPAEDNALNRQMMEKVWPEVTAAHRQDVARVQEMEEQQRAEHARLKSMQDNGNRIQSNTAQSPEK